MRISLTTVLVGVISLIGVAIVYSAMASPAAAGVTCTRYGNQTICNDYRGNSTTCTRYGNQTICN